MLLPLTFLRICSHAVSRKLIRFGLGQERGHVLSCFEMGGLLVKRSTPVVDSIALAVRACNTTQALSLLLCG